MMQELSPGDFANELILIKGTPESGFDAINDMLEARQHETVLEVNLDALVHNINFYRSHLRPTTKIVCMLKASGYGAGSYELAKTLQTHGAAYIAVAAHDEGVALRNAGITMPIMVLNPKVVNYKACSTTVLNRRFSVSTFVVNSYMLQNGMEWRIIRYI